MGRPSLPTCGRELGVAEVVPYFCGNFVAYECRKGKTLGARSRVRRRAQDRLSRKLALQYRDDFAVGRANLPRRVPQLLKSRKVGVIVGAIL